MTGPQNLSDAVYAAGAKGVLRREVLRAARLERNAAAAAAAFRLADAHRPNCECGRCCNGMERMLKADTKKFRTEAPTRGTEATQ